MPSELPSTDPALNKAPAPHRRALLRTAAWAVPATAIATAAPAIAASNCPTQTFIATAPAPEPDTIAGETTPWTVPPDVTSVTVDVIGGAGGASSGTATSGRRVQATIAVTPGDELTMIVGQGGYRVAQGDDNGWVGGGGYGNGGSTTFTPVNGPNANTNGPIAGSGGGGSAILIGGVPLVVAGGGFGQGAYTDRDPVGENSWGYGPTVNRVLSVEQTSTTRVIYGGRGFDGTEEGPGAGGSVNGTITAGDAANLNGSFETVGATGGVANPATGANGGAGQYGSVGSYAPDNTMTHGVSGGGGGGYTGGGSGSLTTARWSGTNPASVIFAPGGGTGGNYAAPDVVTDITETTSTNAPGPAQRGPGSIVITYESCVD